MTRAVTTAGFVVLATAIVGVQVAALGGANVATLGTVVRALTRWWPARWLLLTGWLWVGWHLFVRAHPAGG
jgi:hypothetical protein